MAFPVSLSDSAGNSAAALIAGKVPVSSKGVVLFDSGVLAAGGAASPVLDLTGIDSVYLVATNGDAGPRALTMDTYLDDGTTLVDTAFALGPAAPLATSRGSLGAVAGALGTPAVTFAVPMALPTKAKFSIAAGVTSARLTVWGR